MKTTKLRKDWSTLLTSLVLVTGCGASGDFPYDDGASDPEQSEQVDLADEAGEFGQSEEALSAACGGDDSNQLTAQLATAIANELGRWDVTTDFTVTNGKLALSATGQLHCGSNCKNIAALLSMQEDYTNVVYNHIPSTYRTKLTTWYNTQKTQLTNMVNTMLQVDEGVWQIQSVPSGKLIAPQGGSTAANAVIQQSDQYWGSNASKWRVTLNGTLRTLKNVGSGLCLDLQTNTTGTTSMVQRACSGASTQGFRFAQMSAGVLSIRNATNQALEIPNGNTANGVNLQQGTVEGNAPEHFKFIPQNGQSQTVLLETARAVYALKFKHSGQGLAVSSSSLNDGVSIVQQPYSATDDRFHWYVTRVGTAWINGVEQMTYQFINRRTGKCMDMSNSGSMGTSFVQKTCSSSELQRFILTPTGGGHQVAFSNHGWPVGIQGGSTSSGAQMVEANVGWQHYNMMTFEPILAGEPHKLSFAYSTTDGPCGKYNWFNITQQNGMQLEKPADTFVQLIFAGGKTSLSGADDNPHIAQKVNGNQVAIDPSGYMVAGSSTTSGSCTQANSLFDPLGLSSPKQNACCIRTNAASGVFKSLTGNACILNCTVQ